MADIEARMKPPVAEPARSASELFSEIDELSAANRATPDRETERRILWLRHLAGVGLSAGHHDVAEYPTPAAARLPEVEPGTLPDFGAADATPELLRAAILRDGCMIVRGLVGRDVALHFADLIDRAFAERERLDSGDRADPGYYEPFRPTAGFTSPGPKWIKESGGLLAADSPMLAFELMEMFRAAGVARLAAAYLGEPAVFSVDKTTFRKMEPFRTGAWHQDGSFMGRVRSLNLWLSLSHCGDTAPGLDVVPRRLDELVETGTPGAWHQDQVSPAKAEEAAGDIPILRPIFEPGDAVLFDDLFLHQTAAHPSMPDTRFAIESWFFGSSAFPDSYAPIAV